MTRSLRAQWCAPLQVSIATTQPGGNCAHQDKNFSLDRARIATTRPAASTACT